MSRAWIYTPKYQDAIARGIVEIPGEDLLVVFDGGTGKGNAEPVAQPGWPTAIGGIGARNASRIEMRPRGGRQNQRQGWGM